jgi:hypothetical protein
MVNRLTVEFSRRRKSKNWTLWVNAYYERFSLGIAKEAV